MLLISVSVVGMFFRKVFIAIVTRQTILRFGVVSLIRMLLENVFAWEEIATSLTGKPNLKIVLKNIIKSVFRAGVLNIFFRCTNKELKQYFLQSTSF